jgi:RsiW-degrading membrane proteinase PrsW (M82 family)
LTYRGETDTTTFSGVEIKHRETAAETSSNSWTQTALMFLLFLIALVLFGGLIYFAGRAFKNKPLGETIVSA